MKPAQSTSDSPHFIQRLDCLVQDKRYSEAFSLGVPPEMAERVLFGLAETMEWAHLDRMIDGWEEAYGEPLSAWRLRTILHKVTGVPDASVFRRYLERYEAAGHPRDTVTLTLMMLWKVKQGDYDGLAECFNAIADPDFYAYKTYLNGLLKGNRIDEAKRVFFAMIAAGQTTDTVNCSVLIKRLGERGDGAGTKAVLLAMSDTQMKIDHIVLADYLTSVYTMADINWALQHTCVEPSVECVMGLLESPWARQALDFKWLLELARGNGASAERNFYRKLVPLIFRMNAEQRFEIVKQDLTASEWVLLGSCLRELGHQPSDPVEWLQRVVLDAVGCKPELLEPGVSVCVRTIPLFKRFPQAACQEIVEHLLFQGRFEPLFDLFETVHKETGNFLPQKTYARVVQGIGGQGRVDLYHRFIQSLKPFSESGEIASAIAYAEHEMRSKFSMDNLTWLVQAGKYEAVKAMLEAQASTDVPDLLMKMETYSRIGEKAGFAKTVKGIAQSDKSLESLSAMIVNWVESKQLTPLVIPGRPTKVQLTVANAFFNLVGRQSSYSQALRAKNCLFSETGLRPNARTYKTYLDCLLHHCDGLLVSPLGILAEMQAHSGFVVDLKLYERLLRLAVKLDDQDEVSGVLAALVRAGGAPSLGIFTALFGWMRERGGELGNILKLVETMHGLGLAPPQAAYETMAHKLIGEGKLEEARTWIERSAADKTTRISDQLATDYFHAFYPQHSLPECEAEMSWLLSLGCKVSGDFHVPFLERALEKGDLPAARSYFNLLQHQKAAIRLELYERLREAYLEAGNVNGAHQIHTAMLSAKDPVIRECGRVPFARLFSERLATLLEKNPMYMLGLKPPAVTQACPLSRMILDLAIKRGLRLPDLWCQRVLENLVARGDFGVASELQLYMVVKGIPAGTEMAAKVAAQWRQLSSKKPFL